jgi:hypothetical protein
MSDGLTGLFLPLGDLGAAACAIESLLADPDRARAMGLQGRRVVDQAFTSEAQAARLAELMLDDGDFGVPNVYVPLDEATCRRKVEVLIRHFRSQRSKHWFTQELFFGLMRLRGMECGSASPYAEAFYGRKLVL